MNTENNAFKTKEELQNWLSELSYLKSSDWKCIEETMYVIESEFSQRLRQDFPMLSEDDMRIIFLIRAGVRNVKIARLLNILPTSFRMRRYRIKKKLDITEKQLFLFVQRLFK